MPVLSSFISYRPKRKIKVATKISSPFPVRHFNNSTSSSHPYASPRILDINIQDGRVLAPSPDIPEPGPYYGASTSTPRMELDVEINPEPLKDWFPPGLLKSEPLTLSLDGEPTGVGGNNSAYYGNGIDVRDETRVNGGPGVNETREEGTSAEEGEMADDEELENLSVGDVLADLGAVDTSTYDDLRVPVERDESSHPSWRKPPPTPIRIPNAVLHGPKVQLVRSREASRPTSQVSSPESSAISGTTLARALMANTFVLSGDSRGSRYRSGGSGLTRADSATLPRGEFSIIHSPYWREGTGISEMSLSPTSAPVPPVPIDAGLVYVPPQTARDSAESREKRPSESPQLARQSDQHTLLVQQGSDDRETHNRMSHLTKVTSSPPPTPQPLAKETLPPSIEKSQSSSRSSSIERGQSRRFSIKQDPEIIVDSVTSPSVSEASLSAKDIDNVLDYYSFPDTPEPAVDRNFRPPFSPITEESSSQLSPPTPYRPDSRGSKRSPHPPSRYFLGATPATGGVRVEFTRRGSESRSNRDSISKSLLPIGERPSTAQSSPTPPLLNLRPSPALPTTATPSQSTSDNQGLLLPPQSTIFNRQRSGSAPSPIKVVRDSRDLTTYNITITPRTSGSDGSTPTSADSDIVRQTFPETPSAFSPAFSPGPIPSPAMHRGSGLISEYLSMAVPQTPMSAFLPGGGSIQPSLAQHVLLTRAATSVHGARHSRQASLTRLMRMNGHVRTSSIIADESQNAVLKDVAPEKQKPTPPGSPKNHDTVTTNVDATPVADVVPVTSNEQQDELIKEAESTPPIEAQSLSEPTPEPPVSVSTPPPIVDNTVPRTESPAPFEPIALHIASPSASSLVSHDSTLSGESILAYGGMESIHSLPPSTGNSRSSSRETNKRSSGSHAEPTESPYSSSKGLPRIPPAPTQAPPFPPQDTRLGSSNDISSNTSLVHPNTSIAMEVSALPVPPPEPSQITNPVSSPATVSTPTTIQPPSARRPAMISPPPPQAQLPPSQSPASSLYSLPYDPAPPGPFGSPPPYSSVVNADRAAVTEAVTPSTGGSYDPNYRFGISYSPSPNAGEFSNSSSEQVQQVGQGHPSAGHRRTRGRPPLPAGPRRPSQQANAGIPLSTISAMRERGGSISSMASHIPSSRRLYVNPPPTPKFQTPPLKWRGYTMDAAKWTFTSAQLQAIVSRAIRQSSEASSIRLLRLETLDNEIPEEVERLETQRMDTKVKYKALARRRVSLLESLSNCVDRLDQDGPARATRLLEDLKDVSATLDRLTEELHSVDEQIAQISQLCQAHSASALAMALRKLNASFLKQFAEAQALRGQVESLEAERDEAWKHAESVANDYDDLRSGKVETPDSENRFSRVMAVRKSSIRVSKAGLRPGSRRASQRVSIGSSRGANPPSSARTTFYQDEIPPVPPIPRRRPGDIVTNIPLRSSVGVSTSGTTPTSETRAMVRAQEELYDILGISVNDNRPRRSRSVIGIPGESEPPQQASSPYLHYDAPPHSGRRASLPGSPAPPDVYKSFTADVSIILSSDRAGWI